jgi:hypothetical protein
MTCAAVFNLERAGIARSAAMKMVGHRTESIYRRYAIADSKVLEEPATAVKLAALQASEAAAYNVVPLKQGESPSPTERRRLPVRRATRRSDW